MKSRVWSGCVIVAAMALTAGAAFAQTAGGGNVTARAMGPAQLERLIAPVALYPDPILAQILPAATAPDDIQRANAFLRNNGGFPRGAGGMTAALNNQNWNLSVRSLSYYPNVVQGLASNANWTTQVGQAFVTQERDVLDAVQRLRARAYRSGALRSTARQKVIVNGDVIVIYSAQPNYLYIPQYNPGLFWVTAGNPSVGGLSLTYGTGFPIGPWLNLDFNWDSGQVYYHGWNVNSGGWVAYCRPTVLVSGGGIYVNNTYDNSSFVNNSVIYRPSPSYGVYPSFPMTINQTWKPSAETLNRFKGVPNPAFGHFPNPAVTIIPPVGGIKP